MFQKCPLEPVKFEKMEKIVLKIGKMSRNPEKNISETIKFTKMIKRKQLYLRKWRKKP